MDEKAEVNTGRSVVIRFLKYAQEQCGNEHAWRLQRAIEALQAQIDDLRRQSEKGERRSDAIPGPK